MTWELTPYTLQRDIANAVSNASVGSKASAGYQIIKSAFATPTLRLTRNGTTVFQVTSGQPFDGPQGLQIVGDYSGAAAVLAAADIDTGTWYVELQSGSNTARARVGASGQPFTLSADLATNIGVLIGDCYFTLPSSLDLGGGGGGTTGNVVASVQGYLDQMTGAGSGTSRFFTTGSGSNSWTSFRAEIICPTRDALYDMTRPPYQGDMFSFGGPDMVTPWIWLDEANDSVRGNATLEVGGVEILGRHKTTKQWTSFAGKRRLGAASRWNAGGNTFSYVDAQQYTSASSIMPSDFANYALEFWPEGMTPAKTHPLRNATWVANQEMLHIRFSCRRIRLNTSGDSRAAFKPRVRIGYDFHCSTHPNQPGTASSSASPYGRPEQGTWVGYAMDGGSCSWYLVPFDAANPDRWYSFGVTTVGPQHYPYSGWRPLWAAVAGQTAYSQYFPWSAPPWTRTHDDWRANPAPLPTAPY